MTAEDKPPLLPEGTLSFIVALARPHFAWLALALSAAALSAVFALTPALVIHAICASVLSGAANPGHITTLALLGLAGISAYLLLTAAVTMVGHKVAYAIQRRLRILLLHRLQRMPVSRVEGRAGEYKKILLSDVGRLESLLAHVLPDMVAGMTGPIAGAIILTFVDWRLTLAALAMLPLAWVAQVWTWRGRMEIFEEWNRAEAEANSSLLGYVRGIATLKAFNRQASTLENVTAAVHRLRDLAVTITRQSRYPYALFSSTLSVNLMVVLPVSIVLYDAGLIDRAGVVLATLLGASLTAPLNKVVFAAMVLSRTSVAIDRIRSLLTAPVIVDDGNALLPAGNDIRFENVSFSYSEEVDGLRDIDVEIPEGKITAIVGPSGAGKSTLARLVPRFEEVASGRVLLGGTDIRDLPLEALRSRVAVVFQDTGLFHGSIGDNIAMAAPDISPERLAAAATTAQLSGIGGVTALSSQVSDRGVRLSGGERQRVAIARAIAKDAPILILDEATAFVDAENEAQVQAAISAAGQGRTLLVVAHRLASIVHADRIIVLAGGRVEACGSHRDLLSTSVTYARLWAAQQEATGWKLGSRDRLEVGA
ncbi:Putative multidrug export ATP-binding/permease protein [Mesorhizobium amorphae]